MRESKIQKAICDYLALQEKLGRLLFCRTGVGAIKTAEGRFFKTGRKGWPDVFVLRNGKFYGLEVKSEKGVQSTAQKEMEQKILKHGGSYHVVRNIDDVMRVLK